MTRGNLSTGLRTFDESLGVEAWMDKTGESVVWENPGFSLKTPGIYQSL